MEYKPATYGPYVYPLWADTMGWIIGLLPVVVIFIVAFKQICSGPAHLGFKDRIVFLMKPTEEWGPAGRPCCNLYPERYQNENMHSLMEGNMAEAIPYDDNTDTYIRDSKGGSSGGVEEAQKDMMQL